MGKTDNATEYVSFSVKNMTLTDKDLESVVEHLSVELTVCKYVG